MYMKTTSENRGDEFERTKEGCGRNQMEKIEKEVIKLYCNLKKGIIKNEIHKIKQITSKI